jgi:hypothetical protein
MIIEAAKLAGSGYVAILGCGICGEIPLHFLGETFDHVDLVDLDVQALRLVQERCQLEGEENDTYAFHHTDLTGLISQIEPQVQAIVARASEPLKCLDSLGQLLTSTPANFWQPPQDKKYNLVICSGILTQLQATVRDRVEALFLDRFSDHQAALSDYRPWKELIWEFARQLEDAFITYLESLTAPKAIIYLSDTVHVCWLIASDSQTFLTEGAWIATRTSRLADYLHPRYEIVAERQWQWLREERQGPYWGRLYGVQSLICRLP